MAEYIERDVAIESAKNALAKGLEPSQYMEIIPAVDVAPVRHGLWKHQYKKGMIYKVCSICGSRNGLDLEFNYCPNCGAKMDGGDDG